MGSGSFCHYNYGADLTPQASYTLNAPCSVLTALLLVWNLGFFFPNALR